MKKYTYNKQDYFSEYALRNAIFNNERKIFGEITTDADWKKLGVTVSEYKEPEKTLDELKSEKLSELSTKASSFEQTENKEMYIISSLGYKVNADPKALRNIEVLIELGITQFRNYDNKTVEVTTDNLKTIKSEISINSVKLYQQKWTMQDLINKAETIEELNSIEIKFTMMDFTNE